MNNSVVNDIAFSSFLTIFNSLNINTITNDSKAMLIVTSSNVVIELIDTTNNQKEVVRELPNDFNYKIRRVEKPPYILSEA